jgi:DNA-binding IscR family transcriptional regulator
MDKKNNSNQIWSEVEKTIAQNLDNIPLTAIVEPGQASSDTVVDIEIQDRR